MRRVGENDHVLWNALTGASWKGSFKRWSVAFNLIVQVYLEGRAAFQFVKQNTGSLYHMKNSSYLFNGR